MQTGGGKQGANVDWSHLLGADKRSSKGLRGPLRRRALGRTRVAAGLRAQLQTRGGKNGGAAVDWKMALGALGPLREGRQGAAGDWKTGTHWGCRGR